MRVFLLGLFVLAAATGCGDKPAPGNITWVATRMTALQPGSDSSANDLRGTLYACLFANNPFSYKGQKIERWQRGVGVDLSLDGATISGTPHGALAAYTGLEADSQHVLLVFLDDDDNNETGQCTDKNDAPLVTSRDPLFVSGSVKVISQQTVEIDAKLDHRLSDRI